MILLLLLLPINHQGAAQGSNISSIKIQQQGSRQNYPFSKRSPTQPFACPCRRSPERLCEVAQGDVPPAVALALGGQHGVGPQPHLAVHPRREVDAQERVPRVRHLPCRRNGERGRGGGMIAGVSVEWHTSLCYSGVLFVYTTLVRLFTHTDSFSEGGVAEYVDNQLDIQQRENLARREVISYISILYPQPS